MNRILKQIKFYLKKSKEYKDLLESNICDKTKNEYNRIANDYLKKSRILLNNYPELEEEIEEYKDNLFK